MAIRIGISGWTYPPWRGNFYPTGLPQRLELAYAARRFSTLEVNGTFYSLQRPASFQSWYEQTPSDFVFSLKGGRFITHLRRLKEPRQPLANFFASGVLALREKLGPILWQLPPNFAFDEARLDAFLALLPRTTTGAAALAAEHDTWMKGRVLTQADADRPLRHALEFRHESFLTPRFTALLRRHGVSLVIADAAGKFPSAEDVTAGFVYARLHGSRKLYVSGYSARELTAWAAKFAAIAAGGPAPAARLIDPESSVPPTPRDVFVYFDNTDIKLRAPIDARTLARRLSVLVSGTPRSVLAALTSPNKPQATAPRKARVRAPGGQRRMADRIEP